MGSPFTALICGAVAESGLPRGQVCNRVACWPGVADNRGDALPLRLTGALHRLVLDRADPDLSSAYPPHRTDRKQVLEAVHAAIVRHAGFIDTYLDQPPQTNEVGRAALLWPALLWLAARHPARFELLELGASAGLNQNLARYHTDYGVWQAGNPASPVRIACEWRNGAPLRERDASFTVIATSGCDIDPVSIATSEDRKRLKSYLWPDQPQRLERLDAALAVAASYPPVVERSSATDWLAARLPETTAGVHRIIFHTVMWQYMPDSDKARAEALIRHHGRFASADKPLSWLRFEADHKAPGGGIYLTTWSGDADDGITTCLGRGDFHGRWIDWSG
jgi:hypothetical protein